MAKVYAKAREIAEKVVPPIAFVNPEHGERVKANSIQRVSDVAEIISEAIRPLVEAAKQSLRVSDGCECHTCEELRAALESFK